MCSETGKIGSFLFRTPAVRAEQCDHIGNNSTDMRTPYRRLSRAKLTRAGSVPRPPRALCGRFSVRMRTPQQVQDALPSADQKPLLVLDPNSNLFDGGLLLPLTHTYAYTWACSTYGGCHRNETAMTQSGDPIRSKERGFGSCQIIGFIESGRAVISWAC